MAFAEIIIAVAYFLHMCFAQANNGQHFTPNFKLNTFGESEKGTLQSLSDNVNFRDNYINFAANHLSRSKLSQNRLSDFFNQHTSPLENYQNTIFAQNPNQQQFSSLRQNNNAATQDVPNVLASWNIQPDLNLRRNINLTPSNEVPLTSNILPAPNIANNFLVPNGTPNTQPIIPPTLTISTSLPSFVPKANPTTNYFQLQPRNQVTYDMNPNFVASTEPSKVTTNTNAGNYYYAIPTPSEPTTEAKSHKSFNMKALLPLILNLLNDKSENCPCCSRCHRCNDRHNSAEIPLIDSGYSQQKKYGPPSDESYEDSESDEENSDLEEKSAKFYNKERKREYHKHNNHSVEDKASRIEED